MTGVAAMIPGTFLTLRKTSSENPLPNEVIWRLAFPETWSTVALNDSMEV